MLRLVLFLPRGKAGETDGETATETTPFLWTGSQQVEASRSAHIFKAVLYALQNFYAFMIM
jgi:copper transporter 1